MLEFDTINIREQETIPNLKHDLDEQRARSIDKVRERETEVQTYKMYYSKMATTTTTELGY